MYYQDFHFQGLYQFQVIHVLAKNQFIPLYCVELHKVFLCASRVEEKLGLKANTISSALRRGRNYSCGYHWKILKNKWKTN